MRTRCALMLLAGLASLFPSANLRAEEEELTVAVVKKALKGWEHFQDRQFAGNFQDGHYTDPDNQTQVRDFWSNGKTAKLDRDGNGHFETQFLVSQADLIYVGTIGPEGKFIDVAKPYAKYQGQSVTSFDRDFPKN